MGLIIIDYDKVYEQGERYKNASLELSKIKSDLVQIEEGIKEAWNNDESVVFLDQFEDSVKYFDNFVNFLDNKGELLKKLSGIHEDSEKEFIVKMERSDLKDEH